MHLPIVFLVIWLVAATTVTGNFKELVRTKRENSKDADLHSRCLWLCDCFRKPHKGRVHIVVTCTQMLDFPSATPKDTSYLQLNDNFIGKITETSLQLESLKSLEILECTNCRITTIHTDAFHNLKKLRTIDLKDNSIIRLSAGHFRDQENLVALILTGNPGLNCGPLKELETRHKNPAKVICDEVFEPQSTEKTSEPGIPDVNSHSPTVKIGESDDPLPTASTDAQTEDREKVSETTSRTSEGQSEDHSENLPTSSDAPQTEKEMELVLIGSIVGAVIAFVLGMTSVLTLLWDRNKARNTASTAGMDSSTNPLVSN